MQRCARSALLMTRVFWLTLAWIFPLLGPALWHAAGLHPEFWGPQVPNILRSPALYGTRTDVVTSVPYLLWTGAFAFTCCMPIEVAKYATRRRRHARDPRHRAGHLRAGHRESAPQ